MRLTRLSAMLVFLGTLALLLSACGKELDGQAKTPASGPAKAVTVIVLNDAFDPGSVTIATGGKVTWINKDAIKYSITIDGVVDQVLDEGATFAYSFGEAGTYMVHDRMQSTAPTMTIVVK